MHQVESFTQELRITLDQPTDEEDLYTTSIESTFEAVVHQFVMSATSNYAHVCANRTQVIPE